MRFPVFCGRAQLGEYMRFHKPHFFLKKKDYKEIENIFDSGWVSMGKYVKKLEEHFKKMCSVKYAIGCSSCTQGLIIAIKSAGWEHKNVAVPAFTWPSSAYALSLNNNHPVYCDINNKTWLLGDIDEDCDAILSVDVFGNDSMMKSELPVIYDAAHAYGLKNLGNRGIAEVVSFSHTKLITACEGGMILTNDDELASNATELRQLSSRMMEINAFIALKSIENYYEIIGMKREMIKKYMNGFNFTYSTQQIPIQTNNSVYTILFNSPRDKNRVNRALLTAGIETKAYYEPIVNGLPVTDDIYSRILALPVYYGMDQDLIINTINKAVYESNFYSAVLS
jgi:dTDP-4-amino-4,6-dideoxygalactose transaminase